MIVHTYYATALCHTAHYNTVVFGIINSLFDNSVTLLGHYCLHEQLGSIIDLPNTSMKGVSKAY